MDDAARARLSRIAMIYDVLPIGGESWRDVAEALRKLEVKLLPDGWGEVTGGRVEAPLIRALFRWEAELLRDDADALGPDGRMSRTYDQRRHDALGALLKEMLRVQRRTQDLLTVERGLLEDPKRESGDSDADSPKRADPG